MVGGRKNSDLDRDRIRDSSTYDQGEVKSAAAWAGWDRSIPAKEAAEGSPARGGEEGGGSRRCRGGEEGGGGSRRCRGVRGGSHLKLKGFVYVCTSKEYVYVCTYVLYRNCTRISVGVLIRLCVEKDNSLKENQKEDWYRQRQHRV